MNIIEEIYNEVGDYHVSFVCSKSFIEEVDNEAYNIIFLGPTGSGKSTLIRLLYRFFEPNNGVVKIGDENICDIDVECLRKEIAVVPQDSVLLHNTIKHNINYGNLNADEDAVILAAKMAEIHDSIQVKT